MGTGYALALMLGTTVLFALMSVAFLRAVREEAPSVYESFGSPSMLAYVQQSYPLTTFSHLVLSRRYRADLAAFPRSRAWASWLYWVHWIQLITIVLFFVSLIPL
jgi:hypothetical protein